MHFTTQPDETVTETVEVVEPPLSCEELRIIFDRAYVEAQEEDDTVDFLAIDRAFYKNYGECL